MKPQLKQDIVEVGWITFLAVIGYIVTVLVFAQ